MLRELTKNVLLKAAAEIGLLGLILLVSVWIPEVQAQSGIPSRAGTTIVNGVWDGIAADAAGEMSLSINGVIFGEASLDTDDSIAVDTVYGFSALDSSSNAPAGTLLVTNAEVVYLRYVVQNYGNLASDSFYVVANLFDTSFIPLDSLKIFAADSTTELGAHTADSAFYGFWLDAEASETLFIRLKIPNNAIAQDWDAVSVAVKVTDRSGAGTNDSWPLSRVVYDTAGTYLFTQNDTLVDYGDTQRDTVRLRCASANIRLAKAVTQTSGGTKPGDTLTYKITYDNDGRAASADTAFILDWLPAEVYFLDTLSVTPGDATDTIRTYVYHNMFGWLDHIPTTNDSLLRISRIKFAIRPGVSPHTGTDSRADAIADDSTEGDAGMIKFMVRIR